mmetsp:Transcript_92869/g.267160  ORF Transcript_92869/g.267160 Transcript_92869/m.267160 type:complete len:340 (+) Transcript_92869:764-1783(+)
MTPIKFAPAETAQRASSAATTPQTFTSTAPGATGSTGAAWPPSAGPALPMSSKIAAPGSGARIRASPMRTPLQEMARHSSTSSAVANPLSASNFVSLPAPNSRPNSAFNSFASCAVRPLSSSKVWRLRLFTPRTLAPASSATFSSREDTTSTSGSMPHWRQQAMRARSRDCGKMDTIRRAVSAPWATASRTWYSSMTKSLRKHAGLRAEASAAQRCVVSRTSRRSSSVPLNHLGSVSTERTEAPTLVYSKACSAALRSTLMSPLEGDARLNSAARARRQGEASAASRHFARSSGPPCSFTKAWAAASTSRAGRQALASATSTSRCLTICCSLVNFAPGL